MPRVFLRTTKRGAAERLDRVEVVRRRVRLLRMRFADAKRHGHGRDPRRAAVAGRADRDGVRLHRGCDRRPRPVLGEQKNGRVDDRRVRRRDGSTITVYLSIVSLAPWSSSILATGRGSYRRGAGASHAGCATPCATPKASFSGVSHPDSVPWRTVARWSRKQKTCAFFVAILHQPTRLLHRSSRARPVRPFSRSEKLIVRSRKLVETCRDWPFAIASLP